MRRTLFLGFAAAIVVGLGLFLLVATRPPAPTLESRPEATVAPSALVRPVAGRSSSAAPPVVAPAVAAPAPAGGPVSPGAVVDAPVDEARLAALPSQLSPEANLKLREELAEGVREVRFRLAKRRPLEEVLQPIAFGKARAQELLTTSEPSVHVMVFMQAWDDLETQARRVAATP